MDNNKRGAALVILAGVCWGMVSIFINYLSAAGLSEMQIAFLRQLFSAAVFTLFFLVADRSKFRIGLKDLGLLMCVGLVNGVLFNYLYFYTIIHSRASIAVVLLYTSPVFVMIIARFVFKERFTKYKLIALVLTIAGCVLVTGVLGEGYTPPAAAIITGVLTGLTYALNNILTRMAVRNNDPKTVTLYTLIFSFVFLIPFSEWGSLKKICAADPMTLVVAFAMCLVTGVIAQYVFSKGLSYIESGKAAIYGAAEPVTGTLVGIFLFHEETYPLKLVGIAMVIAAIVMIGKGGSESGPKGDPESGSA